MDVSVLFSAVSSLRVKLARSGILWFAISDFMEFIRKSQVNVTNIRVFILRKEFDKLSIFPSILSEQGVSINTNLSNDL